MFSFFFLRTQLFYNVRHLLPPPPPFAFAPLTHTFFPTKKKLMTGPLESLFSTPPSPLTNNNRALHFFTHTLVWDQKKKKEKNSENTGGARASSSFLLLLPLLTLFTCAFWFSIIFLSHSWSFILQTFSSGSLWYFFPLRLATTTTTENRKTKKKLPKNHSSLKKKTHTKLLLFLLLKKMHSRVAAAAAAASQELRTHARRD